MGHCHSNHHKIREVKRIIGYSGEIYRVKSGSNDFYTVLHSPMNTMPTTMTAENSDPIIFVRDVNKTYASGFQALKKNQPGDKTRRDIRLTGTQWCRQDDTD